MKTTTTLRSLWMLSLAIVFLCCASDLKAQLNVSSVNTPFVIDFDNTVTNVNSGGLGSGFLNFGSFGAVPAYANTQAWSTRGWSDGDMAFDDASAISGDKWRGVATAGAGVGSGGFYGITLATNDRGIGVQPGGSDFTPGAIVLKMENSSGSNFDSITVSYDLYVRNDQGRANSFDLEHSGDDMSYTAVPGLQYTSPEASSGATLVNIQMSETFAVSWADGSNYYIRWAGDDVSGGGSRDEFYIDNISVTGKILSVPSNTIGASSVTPSSFCVSSTVGDSVMVDYAGTGDYNNGNTFTVELSDASGDFTSPTIIGSVNDTDTVGTIACFIPAGTAAGTGYRIRVNASDPATTGADNGTDLVIGDFPMASGAVTDLTCNGANDGSIDMTVSGGTAPYTFLWNSTATTEDLTSLAGGTYTVTVTDDNGCSVADTNTVTEPSAIAVSGTETNVLCNSQMNGSIDLTVSGGTSPYTFNWSTTATTEDVSGLGAGTYTVTVSDDNACTATETFTITEPTSLSASIAESDISCNGAGDGSLDLTVSGGTSPFTFIWSNGFTTEDLSALGAGVYTVTVSDANGCTATESGTIAEPAALVLSKSSTDASCNGVADGSIDLTVAGGTTPYTFLWSNTATTEDLTSLIADNYTVTVTDDNGCTATLMDTITEPTAIVPNGMVSSAGCGVNDGSIDLSVSGGSSPYTFLWSTGATTEDLASLSSGTYTVTVTDNISCTTTETFNVSSTSAVTASAVETNVTCNAGTTGAIDVTTSGGTAPYTFQWSNGTMTEDLTGLAAGVYTLTITDNASCQFIDSYTITEPLAIVASFSESDISCYGLTDGNIDLSVSGGTSPYTFAWSDGSNTEDLSALGEGTYTVTISDGNSCTEVDSVSIAEPDSISLSEMISNVSCNGLTDGAVDLTVSGGTSPYTFNWSNGSMTEDLTGLAAMTYTVTVSDDNACTKTANYVVTEPAALALSGSAMDLSCNGSADGSIDETASGGTAPYSFLWSNGATTEDLSNLVSGTYTVTLTDGNGCTEMASYTISEPAMLVLTEVVTDVDCNMGNNGAISLSVSGGTSPYTYVWSDGSTTQSISNLTAGSYSVTVSDNNTCTMTGSYSVTEPMAISITESITDVNCNSGSDGAINLNVDGGTSPYVFAWSNAEVTEDISNLSAGAYSVTVTDGNACTSTETFTVTEPSAMVVSGSVSDITCNGAGDGAVDLSVSGGTSPYTFLWSTGATSEDLSSLVTGAYTVTVTDGNGCTATDNFIVQEPTVLTATPTASDVSCNGAGDGFIDIAVGGGTSPFTFLWSNAATTEDVSNLAPGTYTVTVTDANLCTVTTSETINEPAALTVSGTATDLDCFDDADGTVDISVSGGTAPYGYSWSNSAITQDLTGLTAATYTVTVTDDNACTVVDSFIVNAPDSIALTAVVMDVACNGEANGAIDLTASGGTGTLLFAWSNAETTEDITALAAGTYTVVVTDANLCSDSATYSVSAPSALAIAMSMVTNVTCPGGADGAVNITADGGTAPYAYAWTTGSTANEITGVGAGTYTVTLTDNNGCILDSSFVVTAPDAFDISASATDVSCNGESDGAIDLSVSGATSPYTFAWSNAETTEDLTGLAAGSYTVTVTDDAGCEAAPETVSISEPAALGVDFTVTDITDADPNGGAVDASVSGGTEAYGYNWSNGETTEDIADLSDPGFYVLTITDANGCELIDSADVRSTVGITGVVTASGNLRVYPNPVLDNVTFDWSNLQLSGSAEAVELVIFDMTGKVMIKESSVVRGNSERIELNTAEWESGVYFYQLSVEGLLLGSGRVVRQ